jgi:hypothetical protein
MLKDSEEKSDQMLRQERLDYKFDQTSKEREERIDWRMREFETWVVVLLVDVLHGISNIVRACHKTYCYLGNIITKPPMDFSIV